MIAQADTQRPALRGGIVLPQPATGRTRAPLDRTALDDALEAGRSLGFVPRDPQEQGRATQARKPGPRRREEQDRLCVAGPRRVTDAFRALCARLALTHWEVLDRLMRSTAAPDPADVLPRPMRDETSGVDAAEPRVADAVVATRPADAATTVLVPHEMMAWVEARVRSARYLDSGDYVRELIRRDQADPETFRALEAALRDATTSAGCFDMATFLRGRQEP